MLGPKIGSSLVIWHQRLTTLNKDNNTLPCYVCCHISVWESLLPWAPTSMLCMLSCTSMLCMLSCTSMLCMLSHQCVGVTPSLGTNPCKASSKDPMTGSTYRTGPGNSRFRARNFDYCELNTLVSVLWFMENSKTWSHLCHKGWTSWSHLEPWG